MKIDVIFTGGTIGSAVRGGWIAPSSKRPGLLIENYKKAHGDSVSFVPIAPYTCLSENIKAENLNELILTVEKSLAGDCDGVIVTHGTDTLQYTSALLSLVFGKTDKCVCVVSSNYPLDDERANGNVNFEAAVSMIQSGNKGIFVPYRNSDGHVNIHIASKLLRHGEFTDDAESLGGAFATFEDGVIKKQGAEYENVLGAGRIELTKSSPILSVVCRPCDMFNYSTEGVAAVLMLPYHSGTLNTESESFKDFCKKCRDEDIPVYAVGMPEGITYESSLLLKELGVISLHKTPFPSAYMNLWAAASSKGKIRDFMSRFCR